MSSTLVQILSTACVAVAFSPIVVAQTAGGHRPVVADATAATQLKRTVTEENANPASLPAATNGTIVANITIKLVTPVPSGYRVQCYLTASVVEVSSAGTLNNELTDAAGVNATVSGSTATCNVKLPYAWYLATPGSDTVSLGYQVYMISSTTSSTAATTEPRSSNQSIPGAGSIKIPANNSTTTYSFAATT